AEFVGRAGKSRQVVCQTVEEEGCEEKGRAKTLARAGCEHYLTGEEEGVAGVVVERLDPAGAGELAGFSDAAGDAGAGWFAGVAVDGSPSFFCAGAFLSSVFVSGPGLNLSE
ncbi:MAG TPA: hypothetical protein VGA17_05225, partial [Nitrospiraceae bacterium]